MNLYLKCLEFNASERPKIGKIRNVINKECKSINSNLNFKRIDFIHLVYENILSLNDSKDDIELYLLTILEQKYSFALFYFGLLYQHGKNVNQNYTKAKKYFELSAQNNNSNALLHLGILYENGFGTRKNYQKAKNIMNYQLN